LNTIRLEIVPIEEDGYHIFITAMINGKAARMLVDTGASRTVFDAERIKSFLSCKNQKFKKIDKLSTGLGTNTMESHTINLKSFSLDETVLKDYTAVVLNMEHVNQSYTMLSYPAIDGVLGGDLLHQLKAVIDYRRKQMRWKS
jgi:predicted aspartyl protease